MGALIGVEVQRPLRLTMYNSWAEMRQALPPRSQVSEAALITEGVHFPSTGVVLILASAPRVAGVTSHELVHFLLDEAMGPLVQLVPAWLNEGLAEYGSTAPSPSYDFALDSAIAQDRLIPLTSLNVPPGVPRDAILMYGEGKSVVTFMVETHGPEKLRGLLRRLGEGVSIDDALEATYGFDRAGLEQQWRRAIGAPPLPQADSEVVTAHAGRIPDHRPFRGRDAHAVPAFVPRANAIARADASARSPVDWHWHLRPRRRRGRCRSRRRPGRWGGPGSWADSAQLKTWSASTEMKVTPRPLCLLTGDSRRLSM